MSEKLGYNPEQENTTENNELLPEILELYKKIENDIPKEDLDSMKECCENDKEIIIGAFYSYFIEFKNMQLDEIDDFLEEKGIFD